MDFFTTNLLEFSRMWWTMEPWVDGFFLTTEGTEQTELGALISGARVDHYFKGRLGLLLFTEWVYL